MPFKKNDPRGNRQPADVRKLFVGRNNEISYFIHNILESEDPSHNIISISGQGGVGKSTLLTRFISEAHATNFKDYCLTALVNERQTTPASIMERFAIQLRGAGCSLKKFEEALTHYKDALRRMQAKRETEKEVFLRETIDVAGIIAEEIPLVGGMIHKGTETITDILLEKEHTRQFLKDAARLEDPIADLTQAFIRDLNQIADMQVSVGASGVKRQRRVMLFFDTFEQLATDAVPWLLDHFLEADVSTNVVLLIAGRDSIENSTPDKLKQWLPYLDNNTIYFISLNSFTEEETRIYLAERGITDAARITLFWQLSRGLPLYLGMLTSNPQGKIDPTTNVVANFLRWIPERDQVKRRLALDASLFSMPFNQDDLTAFSYIQSEKASLFQWLIGQPFVQVSSQEGRYIYHDLARELFSRHLYHRSPEECHATRKVLADYYNRRIERIEMEGKEEVYASIQGQEVILALAQQLFLLPNEESHVKGIAYMLHVYEHAEQQEELIRVLRELAQDHLSNQATINARQIAKHLLQYIAEDLRSQDFQKAVNYLLEKVAHHLLFPKMLLARLYNNRGRMYITLSYGNSHAYNRASRSFIAEYTRAINDFTCALALDPTFAQAYTNRGRVYRLSGELKLSLLDHNRAIELDPTYMWAYYHRGKTYIVLREYRQAISDFDLACNLAPNYAWPFAQRGYAYLQAKNYQLAIKDLDRAIELNCNYAWVYNSRGLAYLWLGDLQQAKLSYVHNWQLARIDMSSGLMIEWITMYQSLPTIRIAEQLEQLAAIDPTHFVASLCRAMAYWIRLNLEQAIVEIEQAMAMAPGRWEISFWKGIAFVTSGQDENGLLAIKESLKEGLPPILLTSWQWLKQTKPDFYAEHIKSSLIELYT